MLSIIVCSVNRKYLLNFEKNVAETIGDNVEYEILAIDNKVMRHTIGQRRRRVILICFSFMRMLSFLRKDGGRR